MPKLYLWWEGERKLYAHFSYEHCVLENVDESKLQRDILYYQFYQFYMYFTR